MEMFLAIMQKEGLSFFLGTLTSNYPHLQIKEKMNSLPLSLFCVAYTLAALTLCRNTNLQMYSNAFLVQPIARPIDAVDHTMAVIV